jgi:CD109 antigen
MDAYGIALTAYALELAESDKADAANQKLMQMAKEDENGLHWGDDAIVRPEQGNKMMPIMPPQNQSAAIETTAYAMLSLVKHGDAANAAQAARWLISKRNAYGGYGSTQDTVVTLQALTEYASGIRADVDLTVNIKMGSEQKQLKINQSNFDVLQVVEIPVGENVEVSVKGKGEAIAQVVRRYNIPQAEEGDKILKVNVSYDSSQVEVNDVVTVSAQVEFNPPVPMEAGMVVLDVSVPTGFQPLTDSVEAVLQAEKRIKRYEVAGRKVIFYIENMQPGDKLSFTFQVKALYPVKAKGVASQAYSYYKPEIRGETLGKDITIQ